MLERRTGATGHLVGKVADHLNAFCLEAKCGGHAGDLRDSGAVFVVSEAGCWWAILEHTGGGVVVVVEAGDGEKEMSTVRIVMRRPESGGMVYIIYIVQQTRG